MVKRKEESRFLKHACAKEEKENDTVVLNMKVGTLQQIILCLCYILQVDLLHWLALKIQSLGVWGFKIISRV